MDSSKVPLTEKRERRQKTASRETITLAIFLLSQLSLIPLKPYFSDGAGDINFFFLMSYELVAALASLSIYFLFKKRSQSEEYGYPPRDHTLNTLDVSSPLQSEEPHPSEKKLSNWNEKEERRTSSDELPSHNASESSICPSCLKHLEQELAKAQEKANQERHSEKEEALEKEKELSILVENLQMKHRELISTKDALEKDLRHAEEKLSSMFLLSKQLSRDLKTQCDLFNEERKKHAIEMRTLLKRDQKIAPSSLGDFKTHPFSGAKDIARGSTLLNVPQGTSVESALSCFLYSCKESLKKQGGDEWPSQEHVHLIRRKFFDSILFLRTVQVGAASIDPLSNEIVAVPSFEISKKDIAALVELERDRLKELRDGEPLFCQIQDKELVFFKCNEKNLDDIVIFGQK